MIGWCTVGHREREGAIGKIESDEVIWIGRGCDFLWVGKFTC